MTKKEMLFRITKQVGLLYISMKNYDEQIADAMEIGDENGLKFATASRQRNVEQVRGIADLAEMQFDISRHKIDSIATALSMDYSYEELLYMDKNPYE